LRRAPTAKKNAGGENEGGEVQTDGGGFRVGVYYQKRVNPANEMQHFTEGAKFPIPTGGRLRFKTTSPAETSNRWKTEGGKKHCLSELVSFGAKKTKCRGGKIKSKAQTPPGEKPGGRKKTKMGPSSWE